MADVSGPFDGSPWAEAQWHRFAATWAPSGVLGAPAASTSTGDLPLSFSGLSVGLGAGRAWVRGGGFERTGSAVMQSVSANTHASFSRRDRIVLRRDLATHQIAPALIQGTPASSPAAPSLTQSDAGSWDLPMFSFLVPPSSGTVISGIIDERAWIDPDGGGYWPIHLDRTSGVDGLRVGKSSSARPSGAGLILPPLPAGHLVAVELSADFYVEGLGQPQSLAADLEGYVGATKLAGRSQRAVSMSLLIATVHIRMAFRIDDANARVPFNSVYTAGLGSSDAIMKGESWTVRL